MERVIDITQVQVGHVVGKGGATIKEIQSSTGAKVEIVDGPRVRITGESAAQVGEAAERVKEIVANQENPNYEGDEGARLRAEANALGDKRSKLFDEATAKRNAGDVKTASKLVEEAKELGSQMEEKNRQAAGAIARHNNADKGKGDDYFDMHGLREAEAMEMLQARVRNLRAKPVGTETELELIPGAGHHSVPGTQKLKGATEAYLHSEGIAFKEISAGLLVATVMGAGEAAAAAAAVTPAATPAAVAAPTDANEPASASAAGKPTKEEKQKEQQAAKKKKFGKCCTVM